MRGQRHAEAEDLEHDKERPRPLRGHRNNRYQADDEHGDDEDADSVVRAELGGRREVDACVQLGEKHGVADEADPGDDGENRLRQLRQHREDDCGTGLNGQARRMGRTIAAPEVRVP